MGGDGCLYTNDVLLKKEDTDLTSIYVCVKNTYSMWKIYISYYEFPYKTIWV